METITKSTYQSTIAVNPNKIPLIDDVTLQLLEIIFFVILSGTISFFGIIGNVINVIVFLKQGFKDSVNISLLALAVSDLGVVIPPLWMSVCLNPIFWPSDISFNSFDLIYLTAGWPRVCFTRITSWITVYITLERCLAIALPLKVKNILTPKRTTFVITAIFIVMITSVSPVYFAIGLGPTFSPEKNKTLLGLVYIEDGAFIENISFSTMAVAQLTSFPLVIIFTVILVRNLLLKSKLRNHMTNVSTSSSSDPSTSPRDLKVVKMVTFISCIFIVCFMPSAINLIMINIFSPDYSIVGRYKNSFLVSWSIQCTLGAVNGSINVIIYYKMSRKYRTVFNGIFKKNKVA